VGSRDTHLEFRDPLISREHLKLETSNLARRRMTVSSNEKNAKLGQKGACRGHVTKYRNFGNTLISRKRLKLETSNLAGIRRAVVPTNKIQWNFGSPVISRKRLKLETSNLARRRMAVSLQNANLSQKGSCGGHVTHFWNYGTPLISRER